jgi:non-ribosomal peptide synthase protein (TIGR01720 family)
VDLSRTVGWFTTLYPVVLDLDGCTGPEADPGELLQRVKETLRAVPQRGIGYGLLRHLRDDETGRRVAQAPPIHDPQIRFNYLGQLDQAVAEHGLFAPARESSGPSRSLHTPRPYLVDVNGSVAGGRLQLDWTYSEAVHDRGTIRALAESFLAELTTLIEHCLSPDAGGYTPSDFPLAGLDDESLRRVADLIGNE